MKELMIILIIVALGTFTFLVFGMTMGKKAKYDFDLLEGYLDRCDATNDNRGFIVEELMRLKKGGLIATEEIDRLTRKIVKKFR